MAVRRLKSKQRGPKCRWCNVKATHRSFGFAAFACDQHLVELGRRDREDSAPDYSDAAFSLGLS